MENNLLTVRELAAQLRVSPKTIRRMKAKIGYIEVGGSVQFRIEDVRQFFRSRAIYQSLERRPTIKRPPLKHLKV